MVRTAFAETSLLNYLQVLAKPLTCTVGVILGHSLGSKDHIIHFAKTPANTVNNKVKQIKDVTEILESAVADHAKHTTRMLPGGMHVLGIFLITQNDEIVPFNSKIKSILNCIYKQLDQNRLLYGNPETTERLVLNYSIKTQLFGAKSYDVITSVVKPAEFKFTDNINQWVQLECKYEIKKIIPITQADNQIPLKNQITNFLIEANDSLATCVYLFDGEIKASDIMMEAVGKGAKPMKQSKSSVESVVEGERLVQVSILLPMVHKMDSFVDTVIQSRGDIKISGQVVSKLWLNTKTTVAAAQQAVLQDIIRSMTARLDMHWDSLIEGEQGSAFNDTSSIHEPPRRVLITLPTTSVNLSDYLFPGEGAHEAQLSLQELLDINIISTDAIQDIEGQADIADFYSDDTDTVNSEPLVKLPTDTNKFMYLVGAGVAILVLLISVILNFLRT